MCISLQKQMRCLWLILFFEIGWVFSTTRTRLCISFLTFFFHFGMLYSITFANTYLPMAFFQFHSPDIMIKSTSVLCVSAILPFLNATCAHLCNQTSIPMSSMKHLTVLTKPFKSLSPFANILRSSM